MDTLPRGEGNAIERRYGVAAANEWQRLLAHVSLSEGFALIVLLVPDRDGASLCRSELSRLVAETGRRFVALEPSTPDDLQQLPSRLLAFAGDPDIGAAWCAAVATRGAADFTRWELAWRHVLAALNQQRNPLRRGFDCPLVFVGADWIVPLFRDIAPDLWSVRTQVVRIAPDRGSSESEQPGDRQASVSERDSTDRHATGAPDPELALREAERFRGVAGMESQLSLLLRRAGQGYLAREDFVAAEPSLREAAELSQRLGDAVEHADALYELGRALRGQGRPGEAELALRDAATLAEQGGDTAVSRGITLDELGRAILDQGRASEAEETFRRALALQEQGGATAVSRGITLDNLGRAIRDQGRASEAEETFRRALALKEQGGATAVSRGITLDMLGRAIRDQGRASEAEETFRRALALKEQGGDTAVSRGITLDMLGRAIRDQGRASEAEETFRRALALAEQGGATAVSRSITLDNLGQAILDQGRASEAEETFRRALALQEQGGATAVSRGIAMYNLAGALLQQGRSQEAATLLRQTLEVEQRGGASPESLNQTRRLLAEATRTQDETH